MRFINLCGVFVALWAGAAPHASAAGRPVRTIEATCRFERPEFTADSNGYSRIVVRDCAIRQSRGEPQMPFRTIRLLLPPSSAVTGLSCRPGKDAVVVKGAWKIAFGRRPLVTGDPLRVDGDQEDRPNPAVYQSTNRYPSAQVELASVQRLGGYDIAVLRVFPVQYVPATGRLVFSPELTVSVDLSSGADQTRQRASALSTSTPALDPRITSLVENPAVAAEYGGGGAGLVRGPSVYDYLLVTRVALSSSFQPLVDLHVAQGLTVHLETMENITNHYAGRDAAEKLRTCIRYAYTNWGVQYVLLGGDSGVVPCRGSYAYSSGETQTAMPSDLYFACLDGTWNSNSNSLWGEPHDGEGGGEVDLMAEVFVGRAPVETQTEVEHFVAKTIRLSTESLHRIRGVLAGEYLGYVHGAYAQGGDALDRLEPAFSNSHASVSWLDDRPNHGEAWTTADALRALNASPVIVAHFGHADDSTVMRLGVADLDSLTNASPFLLYSTGCDAGWFDNYLWPDCIAEELLIHNGAGAFATVVNSRLGWFDGQSEWLYSGEFQQRFFDGLLTGDRTILGVAHQMAKQDLIGSVETSGDMTYRWCYFEIALLGDPYVPMAAPLSLSFRVPPAGSTCVVEWNSRTNALYSLWQTADMPGRNPVCVESNIVATPPLNVYTNNISGMGRLFFWVTSDR